MYYADVDIYRAQEKAYPSDDRYRAIDKRHYRISEEPSEMSTRGVLGLEARAVGNGLVSMVPAFPHLPNQEGNMHFMITPALLPGQEHYNLQTATTEQINGFAQFTLLALKNDSSLRVGSSETAPSDTGQGVRSFDGEHFHFYRFADALPEAEEDLVGSIKFPEYFDAVGRIHREGLQHAFEYQNVSILDCKESSPHIPNGCVVSLPLEGLTAADLTTALELIAASTATVHENILGCATNNYNQVRDAGYDSVYQFSHNRPHENNDINTIVQAYKNNTEDQAQDHTMFNSPTYAFGIQIDEKTQTLDITCAWYYENIQTDNGLPLCGFHYLLGVLVDRQKPQLGLPEIDHRKAAYEETIGALSMLSGCLQMREAIGEDIRITPFNALAGESIVSDHLKSNAEYLY